MIGASTRLRRISAMALLVLASPALAQEDPCTWDYVPAFHELPDVHADFVSLYRALGERVTEQTEVALPTPANDAAARAAICVDGACTGRGPWLVILSQSRGTASAFAWAIVTRHRRRLYAFYRGTRAEGLCSPLSGTLEREGTSFVARVAMTVRDEQCARYTIETHFLADPARSMISRTGVRWVTRGDRSTLSFRAVGEGWAITGCGTERTGPVVDWHRLNDPWP